MLARLVLLLFLAISTSAQTLAIRAGNLIDPATGNVAKDQIILVKDKKIVEVGPRVQIPSGAEVIDLSRSWVMPGLMDAHTHITFLLPAGHPEDISAPYLRESTGYRTLVGAHNAKLVLEAGFTTLRDVGNDANYAAADLRRAIARGLVPGPTILTSGKIIAPFGGQSQAIPPEQGPFWRFEYIDADTPDEIRKAIRQNLFYGAAVIKLVADNSSYHYSLAEIRAAVEEAHSAGVPVSVHVMGGEAARNVILGGADSVEHGFELSDELLRLMKEKGTWLVGTEFPDAHVKAMAYGQPSGGMSFGEQLVDRLRRAYKIGVKLVFGTDVVVELPNKNRAQMMLDYLDVWTAAGVPPAQTLKSMTTNAAELLQLKGKRGAIAAGEFADIIATPQNPLEDIQALRGINFVMKNGSVVKR